MCGAITGKYLCKDEKEINISRQIETMKVLGQMNQTWRKKETQFSQYDERIIMSYKKKCAKHQTYQIICLEILIGELSSCIAWAK